MFMLVVTEDYCLQGCDYLKEYFRRFRKITWSDYQFRHGSPSVCPHGTIWRAMDGFSL